LLDGVSKPAMQTIVTEVIIALSFPKAQSGLVKTGLKNVFLNFPTFPRLGNHLRFRQGMNFRGRLPKYSIVAIVVCIGTESNVTERVRKIAFFEGEFRFLIEIFIVFDVGNDEVLNFFGLLVVVVGG